LREKFVREIFLSKSVAKGKINPSIYKVNLYLISIEYIFSIATLLRHIVAISQQIHRNITRTYCSNFTTNP